MTDRVTCRLHRGLDNTVLGYHITLNGTVIYDYTSLMPQTSILSKGALAYLGFPVEILNAADPHGPSYQPLALPLIGEVIWNALNNRDNPSTEERRGLLPASALHYALELLLFRKLLATHTAQREYLESCQNDRTIPSALLSDMQQKLGIQLHTGAPA